MALQVIPAINTASFKEVKNQLKMVEGLVEWAQLDVADGTFTPNTVWHESSDLLALKTSLKIEVHLMLDKTEDCIENWLLAPVGRIIFHLETVKDPYFLIEKIKKVGKEVGVAIGPDTDWTKLVPFYKKVDLFQILAVHPGLAGQNFIENNLDKIIHLRENCPECILEVDGGVNKEVAGKVAEAGADIVCAASYIFSSKDIKKSIEELRQ